MGGSANRPCRRLGWRICLLRSRLGSSVAVSCEHWFRDEGGLRADLGDFVSGTLGIKSRVSDKVDKVEHLRSTTLLTTTMSVCCWIGNGAFTTYWIKAKFKSSLSAKLVALLAPPASGDTITALLTSTFSRIQRR